MQVYSREVEWPMTAADAANPLKIVSAVTTRNTLSIKHTAPVTSAPSKLLRSVLLARRIGGSSLRVAHRAPSSLRQR